MPSHVVTTMVTPGQTGILTENVEHFRLLDPSAGNLCIRSARLGDVTIAQVRSTGHDITSRNSGVVTFITPLQGTLAGRADRADFETGAGAAAYFGSGRRAATIRPRGAGMFEAIGVVARRGAWGPTAGSAVPALTFRSAAGHARARAMRGYMLYLLGELANRDSVLHGLRARRASEALILNLLAEFDLSATADAERRVSTSEAHVRRVEEMIRERSDEPLTLDAIALEIGVGLRVLQAAFRERRGTTPRAALAMARLERARRRLLFDDPAPSVASAAFLSGFVHLGRFAVAYRQYFGEAPSDTLKRRRG